MNTIHNRRRSRYSRRYDRPITNLSITVIVLITIISGSTLVPGVTATPSDPFNVAVSETKNKKQSIFNLFNNKQQRQLQAHSGNITERQQQRWDMTKNHTTSTPHLLLPITTTSNTSYTTTDVINTTCEDYMMAFLNETTDDNDRCDGLIDAYDAAQCSSFDSGDDDDNFIPHPSPTDGDVVVSRSSLSSRVTSTPLLASSASISNSKEDQACCLIINAYYNEICEEDIISNETMLFVACLLLICALMKSMLKRYNITIITDVAACILVGVFMGIIYRATTVGSSISFDNDLFFEILLPPILFNAALVINKKSFRRYLAPIVTYAVVGTIISILLTGLIVYGITNAAEEGSGGDTKALPSLESFLFGALISSVDPVGILPLLLRAGLSEEDMIYVIIFGESLLNDGVAIVIFNALVDNLSDDNKGFDGEMVGKAILDVILVSGGSIALGLGAGVMSALCFWVVRGYLAPVVEVATFFFWAFVPYYTSNIVGCSGVVAIVAAGLVMDMFVLGKRRRRSGSGRTRRRGQRQQQQQPRGTYFEDGEEIEMTDDENDDDDDNDARAYNAMLDDCSDSQQDVHSDICIVSVDAEPPTSYPKIISTRGQLSPKATMHALFVSECISSVMEVAIFAYLGIVFTDTVESYWMYKVTAIFSVLTSRAVMIVLVSYLMNIIDRMCRSRRSVGVDSGGVRSSTSRVSGGGSGSWEDFFNTDDASDIVIDGRMQVALFFAGHRGAVSTALVERVPVYNTVTQHGSEFKKELKAMTSSVIFFTVFVLGGLTDYIIRRMGLTVRRSVVMSSSSGNLGGNSNNVGGVSAERLI